MLDQLMGSIGGDLINSITEKAGISADQAKEVLPIATETLQSGLMKEAAGGNLSGILGLFNSAPGALAQNSLFGNLKSMFMKNIMTKLGLPEPIAAMVAGSGMESIIGGLAGKLGGAGNITQDSLLSNLGLGGTDGLMDAGKDMLKGKLGDLTGGLFG